MLAKMPINGRRNGILAAYMIQSTAALVNFKIWGRKKTSDSQSLLPITVCFDLACALISRRLVSQMRGAFKQQTF